MKKGNTAPVTVRLSKEAGIKNPENLRVYVVDAAGQLLEEAPFKGYDAALKTSKGQLQSDSKLYIGPSFSKEAGIKKISERHLKKAGAFEASLRFNRESVIDISRLPAGLDIEFFPFRFCHITGHLNKNFTIDGQVRNLPVCHARVHICEVDQLRIYLPPIPEYVVIDIRDWFKQILDKKLELEIKPPIPPRPPVQPIAAIARGEKQSLPLRGLKASQKQLDTAKIKGLPVLSLEVQAGLLSESVATVQETIRANYRILYPYFCYWPHYYHWFYFHQPIDTVYTDCNGKFDTWYAILDDDQPDVYIWVEVLYNGEWVTVYRPGIVCNTWWNYACNTDIRITLTDPRVAPCSCSPLEGSIVWIRRVGNGTSLRRIAMHATGSSTPSPFADVRGLTNNLGVLGNNYVSPFTGQFPFYVKFGDGFPSGTVTHYRWKYRRLTNADLVNVTETYTPQEGPLSRPFRYIGTNALGEEVFYTGNYPLDVTVGSGKIYKIPHDDASVDTGIVGAQWEMDDVETISVLAADVRTDTDNLLNGLYEFVLELTDGAGNTQVVDASVFQVDSLLPSPPDPASTPAGNVDPDYLVRNAVGNVIGFRFLLRIDNDRTSGDIQEAIVRNGDGTGSTTDTICGFAQYRNKFDGEVLLRFTARQPHRYAGFGFSVTKGNGPSGGAASLSGQVPEPVAFTTVDGIPTSYQLSRTIVGLLGTCTQAAFAENLSVSAYHTNGSERVWQYDTSDTAAFAIEPENT